MIFRRKRGRILAIKLGLNPNSSSLGVDVSFLLFGATFVAALAPVFSVLIRARKAAGDYEGDEAS